VVIPLIAMMVWMGVYSQTFLPPVSRTTAHVLEQTQVNVPFQVRIQQPPRMPAEAANVR
jgi:NADH-quinone oxidoreductase subunit M